MSKSKRIITPARREQNRRAQRAYRQRRREFLTGKQEQAGSKRELRPAPAPAPAPAPINTDGEEVLDVPRKTRMPVPVPVMLTVDHFFPSRNPDRKSDEEENVEEETTTPPEPPLFNTYTLLLTACVYNAATLGISVAQFASYNCMSLCSPFYRPYTAMSDDPAFLLARVTHPAIPVHLRPTLPQILFPHHPLLDLLPLPALRAKAITFAATAPSLLDAVDFKLDIVERGGIVCSSAPGMQPWDMRAWTIAPWFSRKWRLLSQP
ncbi:uncharacterized protein CDV56_100182 [Aspergillus thermomutatus]|uniref:BZIP domain-containing protein n=1 Tax=Aspergillus thermomutatus TaxID=41047 RepID=A0A397FWY3_ASPTH|nr:uncharacterized protein CDV56_100182 [Aspergillus thermomutatus]RHZ43185.1 hypothetical protein CDV56_100182 [Aspergillus thermomutatus]